jgi:hypothetical protein
MATTETLELGRGVVPARTPLSSGAAEAEPVLAKAERSAVARWLLHDLPYITMLLLALAGVVFRLPVVYWVILIPVFGVISVAAGWQHFAGRGARLDFVVRQGLSWCALLAAIYLLFNSGVQGVLNANAISLAMMTLLALGTFIAGLQAEVWRICAVGCVLFLAVPGLGWLDQSPLLLATAMFVILLLGAGAWWISARPGSKASPAAVV